MKKALLVLSFLFVVSTAWAVRPIARWDVVPYQKVERVFKVGVVAFHDSAFKVVFSVNGRKAYIAKRATKNDRTDVVEYVFPFDPSKYADGPVTLGAEIVPESGESLVLPELPLYANAKGGLTVSKVAWVDAVNGNEFAEGTKDAPFRTLARAFREVGDGGTVYLLPGTHQMKLIGGGKDRRYWTTVCRAPGVAREQVTLEGGRSGTDKILYQGLDLVSDARGDDNLALAVGEGGATMAWFDDCTFTNRGGRDAGVSKPFGNRLRAFVTGGVTHDMAYGPAGELVRGHEVRSIATEAFSGGNCLIVNSKVNDIDPSGSSVTDADFYQGFTISPKWVENVILYNVVARGCKARAFACRQVRDAAFVNVGVQCEADKGVSTRFAEGLENVIFSRVRVQGQSWWWMKTATGRDDVRPADVRLYDVKCAEFTGAADHPGLKVSTDPLRM